MDAFKEPASRSRLTRDLLTRITQTKTGAKARAATATRKRMILHNAMEYACETGLLTDNPLTHIRWTRPRTTTGVDPRVVINADQAHRFLTAVETDGDRGRHLKAFFACMYYAALRPEEATELRRSSLTLPDRARAVGRDAAHRGPTPLRQQLDQHRRDPRTGPPQAPRRRRSPPCAHPPRARRDPQSAHRPSTGRADPDGRLFVGAHAGPVTDRTYLRVFHRARAAAFTPEEAASPLMEVPYALRHAAVSTWLRTTGDAALVARWAGHSVAVLLKVYAKTVDGTEQETLDRIWNATRRHAENPFPGTQIGHRQPYSTGSSRIPAGQPPSLRAGRTAWSEDRFRLVWQVLGSNQRRRCRQIYSLLPLATRATCHAAGQARQRVETIAPPPTAARWIPDGRRGTGRTR